MQLDHSIENEIALKTQVSDPMSRCIFLHINLKMLYIKNVIDWKILSDDLVIEDRRIFMISLERKMIKEQRTFKTHLSFLRVV